MEIVHSYISGGILHHRNGAEQNVGIEFPSRKSHVLLLPIGEPLEDMKLEVLERCNIPYGDDPIETYNNGIMCSPGVEILITPDCIRANIRHRSGRSTFPHQLCGAVSFSGGISFDDNHVVFAYDKRVKLRDDELDSLAQNFLALSMEETGLCRRMYDEYKSLFEALLSKI